MTVAELIDVLKVLDPSLHVAVEDADTYGTWCAPITGVNVMKIEDGGERFAVIHPCRYCDMLGDFEDA